MGQEWWRFLISNVSNPADARFLLLPIISRHHAPSCQFLQTFSHLFSMAIRDRGKMEGTSPRKGGRDEGPHAAGHACRQQRLVSRTLRSASVESTHSLPPDPPVY